MIVSWIKLYWKFWNSFILLHFELNYYVQWLTLSWRRPTSVMKELTDHPCTLFKKNEGWLFCHHQITNFKLQLIPLLLLGKCNRLSFKISSWQSFSSLLSSQKLFSITSCCLIYRPSIELLGIVIVSKVWRRSRVNREAVVRRCSVKKVFLKISQNSQENTCSRVSFFIKLHAGLQLFYWRPPAARCVNTSLNFSNIFLYIRTCFSYYHIKKAFNNFQNF